MATGVAYEGQDAFAAAANGDFPLVVLLWGMALAAQPAPEDLLSARDAAGNSLLHYCVAGGVDTVDTLHFLLQQLQQSARCTPAFIDARNLAGETPLIRAASAGNLRIMDVLLRYGHAELLAKDAAGNTAAHHAAARGQLWALHFLLEEEQRRRIAASSPQEPVQPVTLGGRSAKHWTALHYAADREHKTVVQYLLARGFDPLERDIDGVTPVDIAAAKRKQRKELRWLEDLLTLQKPATDPPTSFRRTRPLVVLAYASLLFGVLSMSYVLPWWLAVPLIAVVLWKSLAAFRQPHGHGHSHGGGAKKELAAMHPSKRDVSIAANVSIMTATVKTEQTTKKKRAPLLQRLRKPRPEMAMGIWMAWVALFTLFYVALWADSAYTRLFDTRADRAVLTAVGAMELVFLLSWARLAFLCPSEPGTISTHATDVKDMLESAARAEPPDVATKYCRTCLVAKPMRAKHCAQCGVCVARMDHHCAWINRCVGYGNHRLFVVFLLLHCLVLVAFVALAVITLARVVQKRHRERSEGSSSLSPADVWVEIPGLVDSYFLVVMVLVWACCALVALGMMLEQHVTNMARNLTINEQINWRRYPYLSGPAKATPGASAAATAPVLTNPFDRGVWRNVLEFFSRSGTNAVDYHAVFHAPTAADTAASPTMAAAKQQQLQASTREVGPGAMV